MSRVEGEIERNAYWYSGSSESKSTHSTPTRSSCSSTSEALSWSTASSMPRKCAFGDLEGMECRGSRRERTRGRIFSAQRVVNLVPLLGKAGIYSSFNSYFPFLCDIWNNLLSCKLPGNGKDSPFLHASCNWMNDQQVKSSLLTHSQILLWARVHTFFFLSQPDYFEFSL